MNGKKKGGVKQVIFAILITLVVGVIYFYFAIPALNIHSGELYGFMIFLLLIYSVTMLLLSGVRAIKVGGSGLDYSVKRKLKIPVIIAAAIVVVLIIGGISSMVIFSPGKYSSLISIEESSFTEDINEISFDKIPMLDDESAQRLGDRKLGELSDMVSQFEVADTYAQINYRDKPVRVTYLEYADPIKWWINKGEGLPAYVLIDMVTQEVTVQRLDDGMKYSYSEYFNRNILRHLRLHYPTAMFKDVNFEIDDDGNPWWVASVITKTIGLFGGEDVKGAVLVDAISGDCTYYDIDDVPTWVDRVYTAELLMEQYDYYGTYHNGFWNSMFGQKDVTVTTRGYNYIALNDDVWVYTGITSVTSDESNIGFILSNQRTKETKYYAIAGAEEFSAMSSAEGVVQHLNYRATFPLLLNVSGQPTYFIALKDDAMLVKMYAMVNVRQYQIVATGASLAETEQNYLKLLTDNQVIESDYESVRDDELTGVIEDVRSAVLGGTTYYYIKLKGSDPYYKVNAADSELAVILDKGDEVTLSFNDSNNEIINAYIVTEK